MAEWHKIGKFGVDAGLCWIGDPCYLSDENHFRDWDKFVDEVGFDVFKQFKDGVVVSTGYGDGVYDVEARFEGKRVAEIRVRFI